MSLGPSAVSLPSYALESARLDKAIQATLKRAVERRGAVAYGLPWSEFAAAKVPSASSHSTALAEAFGFYVEQMYFTEAASPENLATLASSSPVAQVQQAFSAQLHDEVAHGRMLQRYLMEKLGRTSPKEHLVSYLGRRGGQLLQRFHPAVGVRAVTMAIEYYASGLADALLAQVEEPLLRAILLDIQRDENRHRVLAVESAALLHQAGVGRSVVGRATAAVLLPAAEAWFRHVMNGTLRRHCTALGIPFGDLYERAVEDMRADVQRSLAPGAPTEALS